MPPRAAPGDLGRGRGGGPGGGGGDRGGGRGGDRGGGGGRGGGRGPSPGRGAERGASPSRGGPGGGPRGGRGAPPQRGGPPTRGAPIPVTGGPASQRSLIPAAHVRAIGVKRPGHGTGGRTIEVFTNNFATELNQGTIYHYDGTYLFCSP